MKPVPGKRPWWAPAAHALGYWRHQFTAAHGGGRAVHSPFAYHLITSVLENFGHYYTFDLLEEYRQHLKQSQEIIPTDRGNRQLRHLVKHTAMPPRQAQLLFRMVNFLQPNCLLELGTGVGLTTAYLSAGFQGKYFATVDYNPSLQVIARQTVAATTGRPVHFLSQDFDSAINHAAIRQHPYGMVVLDGNHTYEATLKYAESLLPLIQRPGLLVLHDIHWSAGMYKAWQTITAWPQVTVAIDTYFTGLLFIGTPVVPQPIKLPFPLG